MLDTAPLAMTPPRSPSLRVVSAALGLSPSTLSRMQSNGLDIFAADSYASRYSKPRRGRKPRADAPVMGTPAEIASILSKMRAIATPPPTANVPTPQA